jgi:hypothetical protein
MIILDGGATWNIHYFPADLKVNGAKWYFHPTNEDYILLLTGFDPYKSVLVFILNYYGYYYYSYYSYYYYYYYYYYYSCNTYGNVL